MTHNQCMAPGDREFECFYCPPIPFICFLEYFFMAEESSVDEDVSSQYFKNSLHLRGSI